MSTTLPLNFESEEREPSLSPSLICHGWEYALCQYLLAKAGELPRPETNVDKLRPMLGFAFEFAWHLDHPEYQYQVPCEIEVPGVSPLRGTADFVKETDNTIEVVDTKLVASSVAKQIIAGKCWYYERQLMLYGYALKKPRKRLVLKLAVCDRNYLNWKYRYVSYDQEVVDEILMEYRVLSKAVVSPGKLKRLLPKVTLPDHPWMRYSPLKGLGGEQLKNELFRLATKGGLL